MSLPEPGIQPAAAGSRLRAWLSQPLRAFTGRQWRLLGVIGVANLFDNYVSSVLGLALPQIQSGLGVAESDLGTMIAIIRMGVIPALLLTLLADRLGRGRLVLFSIAVFSLCSTLTAFARTTEEFMALQVIARVFIATETMLTIVIVVEEFEAASRGLGLGVLATLGGLGDALASLIFSFVNHLPFGWRSLYLISLLPLLLLPWFRRNIGETSRFEEHRRTRQLVRGVRAALQPARNLVRMYPGRLVAVCATVFPIAFLLSTAMSFHSKFLQERHGYAPAEVAALYFTVGLLGVVGNLTAGAMGDRWGRKRMLIGALLSSAAGVAVFYNAPSLWVPVAWGLLVLNVTMIEVLVAALGSELFPTSYRSTASGVRAVVLTAGAVTGLWLEGRIYDLTGSHAEAITWMLAVAPIAPLVIAFFLPETATRELEEISPERESG